jgi:hypothetical protein
MQFNASRNWTGCSQFREGVTDRFGNLRTSEDLLKETVGKEYGDPRTKRGIMNFIGEINKVLFGTLDVNDAEYYDEQIRKFEANSDDTDLLKQLVCVKNHLGSI